MGRPRDIFKAHSSDCEHRMSKLGLKIEKFRDVAQLEQRQNHTNLLIKLLLVKSENPANSLGGEACKILSVGRFFSSIFENSWKNNCLALSVTFAPRLYKSYDHAHPPGQQMWPSPDPWPDSKSYKTVEVGRSF